MAPGLKRHLSRFGFLATAIANDPWRLPTRNALGRKASQARAAGYWLCKWYVLLCSARGLGVRVCEGGGDSGLQFAAHNRGKALFSAITRRPITGNGLSD